MKFALDVSERQIRQMDRTIQLRGGPIDTTQMKEVIVSFDRNSEKFTIYIETRTSYKAKHSSDILNVEPKLKKSADLNMRERFRRMEYVSKFCVLVASIELMCKRGVLHLRRNCILDTIGIDFLDGVKD